MPTYELTVVHAGGAGAAAPICALRSTTRTLKVKEIRIVAANTTPTIPGLAVPTNQAAPIISTSTPIPPVPRDPREVASTAVVDTTWSTAPAAPTAPVPYNRAEPVAGVVGNGVSWVFPDPEVVPIGKQIALFNAGSSSTGAVNITFVLDE